MTDYPPTYYSQNQPQQQHVFIHQGQAGYYPQPGNVHIVAPPQTVVLVNGGGCPNCGVGYLRDDYGCFAIFLAIFFFPLGVLCCLAMRERRCSNCSARF